MNNGVDQEARRDISKLYSQLAKIETVVWGSDGSNGLRGEHKELVRVVNELKNGIEKFIDDMQRFLLHDRQESCYGLEAVTVLRKEIEKSSEEERAMESAERKEQLDAAAIMVQLEGLISGNVNERRSQNLIFIAAIASPIVTLLLHLFTMFKK